MNGSRQRGACVIRPAEGVVDFPAQNEGGQVFSTTVDIASRDRETTHPERRSAPDLGDPRRVGRAIDSCRPGRRLASIRR